LLTEPNEIVKHLTIRKEEFHKLQFPVISALDTNDKEQTPSNTSATLQSPSSDKEEKSSSKPDS